MPEDQQIPNVLTGVQYDITEMLPLAIQDWVNVVGVPHIVNSQPYDYGHRYAVALCKTHPPTTLAGMKALLHSQGLPESTSFYGICIKEYVDCYMFIVYTPTAL